MYRQVQDHLMGAEWKGRQNRAAIGRFRTERKQAWQLFEKLHALPKPKDMKATLAWLRDNFQASEDRPIPIMAQIDRHSTLYNARRVLEVIRPIIKDAVDFCIGRQPGSSRSRMADLVAIPLTTGSLTANLMGSETIDYDGTELHLPFDQDHVLFRAGFCRMRDISDQDLATLLNLGANGNVGQAKFMQAKQFLNEVQRTVYFTLLQSVTQVFTHAYRIEWIEFVNAHYVQYEHNAKVAKQRGDTAGTRPKWDGLQPQEPFPTIKELVVWVLDGRTDPGLLLRVITDVVTLFREEGSTLQAWILECVSTFRAAGRDGWMPSHELQVMVWKRGVVLNPDNTVYSDYTILGKTWCEANLPNPTMAQIVAQMQDPSFRQRDSKFQGKFAVMHLPADTYSDAAARLYTPLLTHIARAHGASIKYPGNWRAVSASRSRSRSVVSTSSWRSRLSTSRRDNSSRSRSRPRQRSVSVSRAVGSGKEIDPVMWRGLQRCGACKDFFLGRCTYGDRCRFRHMTRRELLDHMHKDGYGSGRAGSPRAPRAKTQGERVRSPHPSPRSGRAHVALSSELDYGYDLPPLGASHGSAPPPSRPTHAEPASQVASVQAEPCVTKGPSPDVPPPPPASVNSTRGSSRHDAPPYSGASGRDTLPQHRNHGRGRSFERGRAEHRQSAATRRRSERPRGRSSGRDRGHRRSRSADRGRDRSRSRTRHRDDRRGDARPSTLQPRAYSMRGAHVNFYDRRSSRSSRAQPVRRRSKEERWRQKRLRKYQLEDWPQLEDVVNVVIHVDGDDDDDGEDTLLLPASVRNEGPRESSSSEAFMLHQRLGHMSRRQMIQCLRRGINMGVSITVNELVNAVIHCGVCAEFRTIGGRAPPPLGASHGQELTISSVAVEDLPALEDARIVSTALVPWRGGAVELFSYTDDHIFLAHDVRGLHCSSFLTLCGWDICPSATSLPQPQSTELAAPFQVSRRPLVAWPLCEPYAPLESAQQPIVIEQKWYDVEEKDEDDGEPSLVLMKRTHPLILTPEETSPATGANASPVRSDASRSTQKRIRFADSASEDPVLSDESDEQDQEFVYNLTNDPTLRERERRQAEIRRDEILIFGSHTKDPLEGAERPTPQPTNLKVKLAGGDGGMPDDTVTREDCFTQEHINDMGIAFRINHARPVLNNPWLVLYAQAKRIADIFRPAMNYLSRQFDAACEAWAATYSYCCVVDVDDGDTPAYHRAANMYAQTVLAAANAVQMARDKLRLEYDEFKYQLEQPRLRAAMGRDNVQNEFLRKLIDDICTGQSEPGGARERIRTLQPDAQRMLVHGERMITRAEEMTKSVVFMSNAHATAANRYTRFSQYCEEFADYHSNYDKPSAQIAIYDGKAWPRFLNDGPAFATTACIDALLNIPYQASGHWPLAEFMYGAVINQPHGPLSADNAEVYRKGVRREYGRLVAQQPAIDMDKLEAASDNLDMLEWRLQLGLYQDFDWGDVHALRQHLTSRKSIITSGSAYGISPELRRVRAPGVVTRDTVMIKAPNALWTSLYPQLCAGLGLGDEDSNGSARSSSPEVPPGQPDPIPTPAAAVRATPQRRLADSILKSLPGTPYATPARAAAPPTDDAPVLAALATPSQDSFAQFSSGQRRGGFGGGSVSSGSTRAGWGSGRPAAWRRARSHLDALRESPGEAPPRATAAASADSTVMTLTAGGMQKLLQDVEREVRSAARVRLGTVLAVLPSSTHKFHRVLLDTGADHDIFHPDFCVMAPQLPRQLAGGKMAKGLFQKAGAMGPPAYMDISVGTGYVARAYGRMFPASIASKIDYSILSFNTSRMMGFFEERLADELFGGKAVSDAVAPLLNSDGSEHLLRAPLVALRPETQRDLDEQRKARPSAPYCIRWRDTFRDEQRGAGVVYVPILDYRGRNPVLFHAVET